MKYQFGLVGAVVAAGLSFGIAETAEAAHLEFFNDASARSIERFEVFCNGTTCDLGNDGVDIMAQALFAQSGVYTDDDGDTTTQNGQLFDLPNNGLQTEIDFVNANTVGGDFFTTANKVEFDDLFASDDTLDDKNFTFTSSAKYLLIKTGQGPNVGLIHNLTMAAITYNYVGLNPGPGFNGNGISHYTEFGDVSQVPLPAAGLLLLTALSGIGFVSRRRRAA